MDKETLLKPSFAQAEVEVPGKGSVTVRALTRAELHQVGADGNRGKPRPNKDVEALTLVYGLVDPKLDIDEVRHWMEISPMGEIQPVLDAIQEVSGMKEGSDKNAYKSVRSEPDA